MLHHDPTRTLYFLFTNLGEILILDYIWYRCTTHYRCIQHTTRFTSIPNINSFKYVKHFNGFRWVNVCCTWTVNNLHTICKLNTHCTNSFHLPICRPVCFCLAVHHDGQSKILDQWLVTGDAPIIAASNTISIDRLPAICQHRYCVLCNQCNTNALLVYSRWVRLLMHAVMVYVACWTLNSTIQVPRTPRLTQR